MCEANNTALVLIGFAHVCIQALLLQRTCVTVSNAVCVNVLILSLVFVCR